MLGGAFVGVGLIWLVAANLEQLSPVTRFAGVTACWLGAVAGAELLAARSRQQDQSSGSATVGAVRLVAALAFGAVVFQAAQSLQVPAYDSGLVGAWAAGALLYGYAAGAVAPLLVGILTGVGWYVWAVTERTDSVAGAAVALLLAAVLATAVTVAHTCGWQPRFAPPWRLTGALLALGGLFLAALPRTGHDGDAVPGVVWAGVAADGISGGPRPAPAGRRRRGGDGMSGSGWGSRPVRVATVCLLQLVLVGVAVAPSLSARVTGEEYRLAVAPVDPVDPFRGAYVTLSYPALTAARGDGSSMSGTVFVPLEPVAPPRERCRSRRAAGPLTAPGCPGQAVRATAVLATAVRATL